MKEVDIILNSARESLGQFCIESCGSLCCRKGFLSMYSKQEVEVMTAGKYEEFIITGVLIKESENKYVFNLEKHRCLNLGLDFKCNVHKNVNRPRLCKDFPLFLVKNFVVTASICPAIESNLLESYLKKLEELGYKII